MRLTPHEQDRLLISYAAELARRRQARGLKLNHPEAVAVITDPLLEGARAGCTGAGGWGGGRRAPSLATPPIRSHEARPMIPGEIAYGDGDVVINEGAQRLELSVVNNGDRPGRVGSPVHRPQANAGA